MDLSKFDVKTAAKKGAELHLRNPFNNELLFEEVAPENEGDEPTKRPVTITLMGRDSPVLLEKTKEIERRRVKGEEISDAEASTELLATGIVAWQGIALPGTSEDAECNFENAVKILTNEATSWVQEQASIFASVRRNFIGNVPTT
ncbi:hypothetical protein [uncultured Planktomarina sp.]|uniref:hypothetical protein n=1 Tax=uncultured Planktomarina sp. TaxID=1538529 RepID=UPI00326043A1